MKNNASLTYGLFLILGDFMALVAAFVGAYLLRVTFDARPLIESIPALDYLSIFLALLPFWLIIFALLGLYNSSIYEKRFSEIGRLAIGSFIGLMFVIFYDFVVDPTHTIFPARLVPFYGYGLAFAFLVIFRNLARFIRTGLFSYKIGLNNVLLVGNTNISHELISQLIDSRSSGYRVLGVVSKRSESHARYPDLAVFDTFEQAVQKVGASNIHSIIQTELYVDSTKNNAILEFSQKNHVAFRFVPGNSELFIGNIDVSLFRSIPVIAVHQTALIGWGRIVKRIFDVIVASILLIIVSPLMIIIAMLVKTFDPQGPVFFRQTRLTRFNHEFRVFKFRTQYQKYGKGTPEDDFKLMGKPELAKEFRANGDFLAKDPRITPIGRFLRKASLDELPQLFNVLKGDLSLVGPRALIPQELSVYEKRHAILAVKSGITGLAQVSGRKSINFDERRKLDVYYVQNWSFWFDIVILLKTFRAVINGRGAE